MRLQYRKRDPEAGTFRPQSKREKGKRATHARRAEADQEQPIRHRHPDRAVKERVDRQHDRRNRSSVNAPDGREGSTEYLRDAEAIGIRTNGKPLKKKFRQNLRKAKATRPDLYPKLLLQYCSA
jgi:hypothetical protein